MFAPNANLLLSKDDDVFIKFKNILIEGKTLIFDKIEIYKYVNNIDNQETRHVSWWSINDFGGFLKSTGEEFVYEGNKYVQPDEVLSEDGKIFFIDIYDGQLLIEEYKNIFPPMKWYNMVNPQETYFDVIVSIYKNKR